MKIVCRTLARQSRSWSSPLLSCWWQAWVYGLCAAFASTNTPSATKTIVAHRGGSRLPITSTLRWHARHGLRDLDS